MQLTKIPKTKSNESFSRKRKRVETQINHEEAQFLSHLYKIQSQLSENVQQYERYVRKDFEVRKGIENQVIELGKKVESIMYNLDIKDEDLMEDEIRDPYDIVVPLNDMKVIPTTTRKEMFHKVLSINERFNNEDSYMLDEGEEIDDIDGMHSTREEYIQTMKPQMKSRYVQTQNDDLEIEELRIFQNLCFLNNKIQKFRASVL